LAFYGEVADQSADWLAGQAAQAVAGHSPFELHLSGAGQFPSGQSWIGLGGQTDRLLALMADCRALWPASADPVQVARPHLTVSRPHLTVSRRRRDRVLADALRALAVYRGPTWTVERARLFQSELGQGPGHHPLYTPLADLPLAAVPSA
jgi:2'-5' RNA ligase